MRQAGTKTPLVLSAVVAALMALQSALGLALSALYRDAAFFKATWFGNDAVTLIVAVPLLLASIALVRRGSIRGLLLWLGMLGYAAYNYAYYMLGVSLNAFFPLYPLLLVLAVVTLVLALARLDVETVAGAFSPRTPVRIVGGYFVFVAFGLAMAWIAQWAAFAFGGTLPSIGPDPFRLVASLDLTLMVTGLGFGGVLLWMRRPWGYVIASIAGVQGTLYLLVLTVNSAVVVSRGIQASPGEVPVWGTLMLLTGTATAALLASASGSRGAALARRTLAVSS